LAAICLLWLASHVQSWYVLLGVGIVFSYVMLCDYALLHDATHNTLHPNSRGNYWLGLIAGLWFPVPFSMVYYTHRSHHRFNRTDAEMFDSYYPTDNRLLKYLQWYSILCGLFWPLVPLGALLIACTPRVLRTRWLASASPARGLYYVSRMPPAVVRRIRWETLGIVAIFAALSWLLRLNWAGVLVCYACFSFNWSTRQYITHAFSPRDVVEGAFNLRHNRLMDWILLHGQLDLNHHRRPDVSWYYLPRLSHGAAPERSYVRQYFRQWRGPVLAMEPAPEPAHDELLEAWTSGAP
jgi:fatty acid desaturase